MVTDLLIKSPQKYTCNICAYMCSKNSEYTKHLLTQKHCANATSDGKISLIIFSCKKCNKVYKSRNGLWKHNKVCDVKIIREEDTTNLINKIIESEENIIIPNTTIEILLQENRDFKNIILDLQKQVIDICSKMSQATSLNINNNTTNNNNKTFNLQFFLNEECKDAMNLNDFVESVQLQMTDLEKIGELGYIEGVSKFIMGKLNETDVNKRPVHCSDAKRETLYVKDDNVWTKEGEENSKIRGAVKKIEKKNIKLLNAWKETHAGCMDSDSPYNDQYTHMIIGSLGGCEPDNVNKVIKKIAKATIIDK